jgi:flagellar assembly protein FliH
MKSHTRSQAVLPLALTDFGTHNMPPVSQTPSATHERFERLKLVECHSPQTFATNAAARQKSDELQTAITALNAAASDLQSHRDRILEQGQIESVKLGIAIAERLLRQTLNVQPEAILDLVKTTLSWAVGAESIRVRLHPTDCELVEAQTAELTRECSANIQYLADTTLTRGDCLVETAQGTIDGRWETMLQRITEELLDDIA